MKTKPLKAWLFAVSVLSATALCQAQTTTREIITDVETGNTYDTDVTRFADGSVEFAMNPNEQVPTPDVDPSLRIWESGPRTEYSFSGYIRGAYVEITVRRCGNSVFWPCAWCSNNAN